MSEKIYSSNYKIRVYNAPKLGRARSRFGNQKRRGTITKIFVLAVCIMFWIWPIQASSLTLPGPSLPNLLSSFQIYIEIPTLKIEIPTVVEVPLTNSQEAAHSTQAVWEVTGQSFQPFLVQRTKIPTGYTVNSSSSPGGEPELNDNSPTSFVEYLPELGQPTQVSFVLEFARPVTSDTLTFSLPPNVQLPERVSIFRIDDDSGAQILVNDLVLTGTRVSFPQSTAQKWQVDFTYTQNLRLAEIGLVELGSQQQTWQTLRFLARPGESYRLYLLADQPVQVKVPESGDLFGEPHPLVLMGLSRVSNPEYQPVDTDQDGVGDEVDNCPRVSNPEQTDVNQNGIGDACDDFDQDGILNAEDNCPDHANRYQQDTDGDGIGDHCDSEESRLTERLVWLPWLGILVGVVVVSLLLKTTVSHQHSGEKGIEEKDTSQPSGSS